MEPHVAGRGEPVREAMGETVNFPRSERAWDILAAMTCQIVSRMGEKHSWIQDVRAEIDPFEWSARPQLFLRAFRKSLNSRAGRQALRSSFHGLARVMG